MLEGRIFICEEGRLTRVTEISGKKKYLFCSEFLIVNCYSEKVIEPTIFGSVHSHSIKTCINGVVSIFLVAYIGELVWLSLAEEWS